MKMSRLPFLILLTASVLALTHCSANFNRAWAKATTSAHQGIEGPWVGSWLSHHNGHSGELRCVVGPDSKGNGDRLFMYHAIWGGVLSGNFNSVHHVTQKGGITHFTADSDLGTYGQFHADGTIKDGVFKASFKAAGDYGVFEMHRPKP